MSQKASFLAFASDVLTWKRQTALGRQPEARKTLAGRGFWPVGCYPFAKPESLMKNPRLDYAGRGQRPAFYYSHGLASPRRPSQAQPGPGQVAQNDPYWSMLAQFQLRSFRWQDFRGHFGLLPGPGGSGQAWPWLGPGLALAWRPNLANF